MYVRKHLKAEVDDDEPKDFVQFDSNTLQTQKIVRKMYIGK